MDELAGQGGMSGKKKVWGRITEYLQLFGVNISSGLPTSNYRLDLVFVVWLIRLNSTNPTTGICIL